MCVDDRIYPVLVEAVLRAVEQVALLAFPVLVKGPVHNGLANMLVCCWAAHKPTIAETAAVEVGM